jgi:hypothetical protein
MDFVPSRAYRLTETGDNPTRLLLSTEADAWIIGTSLASDPTWRLVRCQTNGLEKVSRR